MTALIALLLALSAAVLPSVELHEEPIAFRDLYGVERYEDGAAACVPGSKPIVWIARSASLEVAIEELAHAYDCLDDGMMNGSPMPTVSVLKWHGPPETAVARLHVLRYREHPAEAWAAWCLQNPGSAIWAVR